MKRLPPVSCAGDGEAEAGAGGGVSTVHIRAAAPALPPGAPFQGGPFLHPWPLRDTKGAQTEEQHLHNQLVPNWPRRILVSPTRAARLLAAAVLGTCLCASMDGK